MAWHTQRDRSSRNWTGTWWLVLGFALVACIPDQGSSYAPDAGAADAASAEATDGAAAPPPGDAGTTDGPAATTTVVRRVFGTTDDKFQFTDENGQPAGPSLTKLYVPANSHVHFILSSDPSGEVHKFRILSPPLPAGFGSPDVVMPVSPPAPSDWVAPATPATYSSAIDCDVHKGMTTDLVVQ
jgi:hypothetical protein